MADTSPYKVKTLLLYLADLERREQAARQDVGLTMSVGVVVSRRKLRQWPDVQRVIRDCEAAGHTFDAAGMNQWVAKVCKVYRKLPDDVAGWNLDAFCDLAEKDDEDRPTATTTKRRGRKKADYETVQREAQLAAEWKQACETGLYKTDFAKDHGMKLAEFDALLDRVAKRKARSDN